MSRPNFAKFLLEAVDEGLVSLGESSKQAIYFHLEKRFKVQKQEIPCRIEAFTGAIEKIFGLGANFLESLILKRLYEKAGLNAKEGSFKDLAFAEIVVAVKRMMEQ